MELCIIGSTALKYHFPDFNREPKDIDYAVKCVKGISNKKGVEYLENPVLIDWFGDDVPEVCPANELYTLKMSHIAWDVFWEKNMWDITFLKQKGCILQKELFHKLYEYWNTFHKKNKRSDLKMTSADFFNNAVKCPYDHDTLHTILNPIPTYTKILIGEVEVSEELFNQLTFEDKCNLVYEEVELMSWERWRKEDFRAAYNFMLKKFILSHAPIWEMIFICENYKLLSKYRRNHFKILEEGIKQLKTN